MWVRKSEYDEEINCLRNMINGLQNSFRELNQKHCEHLNVEFEQNDFIQCWISERPKRNKHCSDCGLVLEYYDSYEENQKAILLHEKQTAERKLKEVNEAIAKNEKKNK